MPGRFKVAICGAGISGLVAAVSLSKYDDIDVDIYEGASKLAEVGAGVGMFPRPWRILENIGVDEDLLRTTPVRPKTGPVPSWIYRKADGEEGIEFFTLTMQGSFIPLHRPTFQNVLVRHLPSHYKLHTSKRLTSYTQTPDGVIIHFEDGSTATCDVLLAADGLKSAARTQFLKELAEKATTTEKADKLLSCIDPVWSGLVTYRALIPAEKLRELSPDHRALEHEIQYMGKDGIVVGYPIMNGTVINFVAYVARFELEGTPYNGSWSQEVDVAEFASTFAHWEPEVQSLIQCVENPSRWAIHTVKPLETFVSGRVALLGDAAHAMTPNQGSGAGQAAEDAYIAAAVLGHPSTNKENSEKALHVYDAVRRPFAQDVVEKSRFAARISTLNWPEEISRTVDNLETMDLKLEALSRLAKKSREDWEWAWLTTLDDDVERANHMLLSF